MKVKKIFLIFGFIVYEQVLALATYITPIVRL